MARIFHLPQLFCSHHHFRVGELLRQVVLDLKDQCVGAVAMPNLVPAILTAPQAMAYWEQIRAAGYAGIPFMTIKLTPETTPAMICEAAQHPEIRAAKLYPDGVTTNSEGGVRDFSALDEVYAEMERVGMHLLLHGEMPGVYSLHAEQRFLSELPRIATKFPKLRITLEHITTAEAVDAVWHLGRNVTATITLHHLLLTTDDVIGSKIQPHNFCKPVAKQSHDRMALLLAAFSGNPKFRFGSDSAPHLIGTKECAEGCAGVYTAPIMVPLLVEIFDRHDRLGTLAQFTSGFAADWFDLDLSSQKTLTVVNRSSIVPALCGQVVPFMAGKTISWSL